MFKFRKTIATIEDVRLALKKYAERQKIKKTEEAELKNIKEKLYQWALEESEKGTQFQDSQTLSFDEGKLKFLTVTKIVVPNDVSLEILEKIVPEAVIKTVSTSTLKAAWKLEEKRKQLEGIGIKLEKQEPTFNVSVNA
jgi:hypothetical protein